jgi:GT2 family glycosyltransferase
MGSVSVVVVTFNSRDAVAASLPAVRDELQAGDELIVVDNASSDGTLDVVRQLVPDAVIVRNGHNAGFAEAANAGARAGRGELLVILNPDATPAPGFGAAIRTPLTEERGWSAWMGLVTAEHGRVVNTNGGIVHFTGISWAGEAGVRTPGSATGPREVAFASGACLAIPRATWEERGGFAAHYFMYHEDVDLSLRIRLAGGRVGVEPAAVVDHDYTFGKGAAKWRRLERNRWATILRCYPAPLLALLAPALLATELALLVAAASGGWLPQKLRAYGETLTALPALWRERRAVQATRRVSAGEFAAWLSPELDSPFLGRAGRSPLLRMCLRAYWGAVLKLLP